MHTSSIYSIRFDVGHYEGREEEGNRRGGEGMEEGDDEGKRKVTGTEGKGKGWKKGQRGNDRGKDDVTQRQK